jgi:beta-barrel assembly-enhancing protease
MKSWLVDMGLVGRLRSWAKNLGLAILAIALAVSLQPSFAAALEWYDLLRALPSVIQTVQLSNLSDRQEIELGKQINQEISSQVRISSDRNANNLVRQIGRQLIPQSDRPDLPYTFQVVEDTNLNAFATMGGFIYVNTGTIAAADNQAQLAGVIAHEMGHITGKHVLEQMQQMALAQGVATVVGADRDQLVGIGVQLALKLPHSREAEFDADRRGLLNIAKVGYAPTAMPDFMKKLTNKGQSNNFGLPGFLSTHPATEDRIAALNQMIQSENLTGSQGLNNREYQNRWRQNLARPDR